MKRKPASFFAITLLFTMLLSSVVLAFGQESEDVVELLKGKTIGVQTGTISGEIAKSVVPDVKIEYFNSSPDTIAALKMGKIDAICGDEPSVRYMLKDNPDLHMIPQHLEDSSLAAAFAKTDEGQALCDEYSAFLEKLWADGTIDEIEELWFGDDEDEKVIPDLAELPDTNGTLKMACDPSMPPFTYVKDNQVVGYDVDISYRFCKEYGYRLEIVTMSFDGVLASVQTGKCDFAASEITDTKERRESVLFSTANYKNGTVAVVLGDSELNGGGSFWENLADSFEKTFVREARWKLFAGGIGTTMLITLLAVVFGTAFGFGLFMLCRNGNPVANVLTRFATWLIQGMPVVVLLMILYYIIFGRVDIGGIVVAVIGFTLTFGAAVFSLIKMGVGAVDKGQYEAACALGFSNRKTFFKIILPQALPHVIPAYKGEIVGLIKSTAIVGYIAVQDLTKVGDIVRSRTYEAFFPLIAITVLYFVLEGVIGFLVSRIGISFNPKRRKAETILKGVKTGDQD